MLVLSTHKSIVFPLFRIVIARATLELGSMAARERAYGNGSDFEVDGMEEIDQNLGLRQDNQD